MKKIGYILIFIALMPILWVIALACQNAMVFDFWAAVLGIKMTSTTPFSVLPKWVFYFNYLLSLFTAFAILFFAYCRSIKVSEKTYKISKRIFYVGLFLLAIGFIYWTVETIFSWSEISQFL